VTGRPHNEKQTIPTEPAIRINRLGVATFTKENRPMDLNTHEELKAHLMATNQEFRELAAKHSEYERQIQAIESLPHVTPEDELEEQRLKKLKLHIKDQMMEIINRYRTQQVS
jgi:Uncharacterized protein conserved in bacteria